MNVDTLKGTAKKVEGSVESTYGNITGNKSAEYKGESNRILGEAQASFGKAKDCVTDWIDTGKQEIREKPVQSALIALGVGFILGGLLNL